MSDYIKREDAVKIIEEKQKYLCPVGMYGRHYVYGSDREKYDNWEEIIDFLENLPAADVEEVKHGKWIGKQLDNFRKYEVTCSNCGWVGIENYDSYNDPSDFNYCPNCGAKMTED